VYREYGLSSRSQLAAALGGPHDTVAAPGSTSATDLGLPTTP
jgi:hypothetical protein